MLHKILKTALRNSDDKIGLESLEGDQVGIGRFIYRIIYLLWNSTNDRWQLLAPRSGDLVRVKVGAIHDGDTFSATLVGQKECIRLDAIDCPEGDQPWGDNAKYGLIKLIGGRDVFLEIHGRDIHHRILATVFVEDEAALINVNEKMVNRGHAWVYRDFLQHLSGARKRRLTGLEEWARSEKVGLWKEERPIPPWHWRRRFPASS